MRSWPKVCAGRRWARPCARLSRAKASAGLRRARPWLALAFLSMAGCAPPVPDLSPFAEQTAGMSSAIEVGVDRTRGLLLGAELERARTRELERAWRQTEETLDALVAYSGTLADLAVAGNSGVEVGAHLAAALDDVVGVLGSGPIPPPFEAVVSELAASVAAVRAHRALRRAVGAAQPAVDRIAELVVANLASLDTLAQEAGLELATLHEGENGPLVAYHASLERQERTALRALALILDYQAGDDEALAALLALDRDLRERRTTGEPIDGGLVSDRADAWRDRLDEARAGLDEHGAAHARYLERAVEIREATETTRSLVRKSRLAVWAWARAHGRLQASLETRRPIRFLELVSTVARLRDEFARGAEGTVGWAGGPGARGTPPPTAAGAAAGRGGDR